MIDNYGRTLSYLRLSVTDRCNLRCQYCMPNAGIEKQNHEHIMRNEEFIQLIKVMAGLGLSKVRLTGGEPLVRKGLVSFIQGIRQIEGINEVTLTTNGLLLEEQAEALKEAGINRVNISLDSLDEKTYADLTRGGDVSKVLRGIKKAQDIGMIPIKINVVVIKGVNDHEIEDFLHYFDNSIQVRFIELMPIGEAASWSKDKFLDLNAYFRSRTDVMPMDSDEKEGPCKDFIHIATGKKFGIINAISEHFCSTCNRLRVTSEGILKTCLHDDSETPLRPFLYDEDRLIEIIHNAVSNKQKTHRMNETQYMPITRNMYTIGG